MMNIETLLQAAQILESQQSIPPKKQLANGECNSDNLSFFFFPPSLVPIGSEG
jgi:hypothetical protein